MSAYQDYVEEKGKIDELVSQDYLIAGVTENLNGAYVRFQKAGQKDEQVIHIGNADARKYFSSVMIKQQKI